jgi:hypothetical protein
MDEVSRKEAAIKRLQDRRHFLHPTEIADLMAEYSADELEKYVKEEEEIPERDYSKRYQVFITRPPKDRRGEWYCMYDLCKWFGNLSGRGGHCVSRVELMRVIKATLKGWERDDIISRDPEQPTMKNVQFYSFTPEVQKAHVFGSATLFDFTDT